MTKTETAKKFLKRTLIKEYLRQYYTVDGKRDGEYKEWYENGQPFVYCNYKDGELDGEYKRWHQGQLLEHCYHKNGKLDGEYKSWNNDGQLHFHYYYKNDVKINDQD